MRLFSLIDTLLRDRETLYRRAAEGDGLKTLCGQLLLIFVVTSGLYGAAMGSFRWIHPDYFFSDYELSVPSQPPVTGDVAGMNAAARKIYTPPGQLGRDAVAERLLTRPGQSGEPARAEVRFNRSRPTDPYAVAATGEEKGYGVIELAPGAPVKETDAWKLPLLVAAKTPVLFILSLLLCCLVLYVMNLAFGMRLCFLPSMTLVTFALAATGVLLAVFIPIVLMFTVVTENYHFIKMLHVVVFAIAGLFGVCVLSRGLLRLAPEDMGRGRTRTLLLSWLLLYALVGGQLAWTLKPFLGTPYLPATPPFRVESGNIYVSFCQSLSQMRR
jgi:hypothetical protein